MKSEKWALRALKGTLVGYGHTIYRVHVKDQKRVIRVKDLRIFEDYEAKKSTKLPDYLKGLPTFQGFLLADNDDKELELTIPRASQKAKSAREEEQPVSRACKDRKAIEYLSSSTNFARANDAEPTTSSCAGQMPNDAENLEPKGQNSQKSRTGRTVKQSAKTQEATIQAKLTINNASNQRSPPTLSQSAEVESLIV